ncbi:RelA/SpoT domain-containing protein [Microbacterium sp. YY-03]|uniref:RelA/SpoT domain-containing protein n=1 Tax=Microbacterium sp. YY-03 TaxID=3421636 RepID=UPI003D168884
MTVPSSLRTAYREQKELAELLKKEVDAFLRSVPPGWYVESRVKDEESFHQKMETGRYLDPLHLEDFFGAMVVVPLPSDLPKAIDFVETFFETKYRRPLDSDVAPHPASSFQFNDLRLYGTLRADDSLPASPIEEIVFEIQVRTFFQHAWSTATHDLVYKHPRFSWARSRVAAQVKAMLEVAEMSIDAIDELESSPVLPHSGSPENGLNELLSLVESHWNGEDLPANRKRMTETLSELAKVLNLDVEHVSELLERGANELGGHPAGWSPYQCVVDYSSRYEAAKLLSALRKGGPKRKLIFVDQSVLDRLGVSLNECPAAAL